MNISEKDLSFVKQTIKKHLPKAEVYLFGSRVTGVNLKPSSDLDVLIKNPDKIEFSQMYKIREAFEECDITYKIDLIDNHNISDEFRGIIEKEWVKVS